MNIIGKRIIRVWILLVICLTYAPEPVLSDSKGYRILKTPGWVTEIPVPDSTTIPHDKINDGTYHLLVDSQAKLNNEAEDFCQYYHYAYKIVTPNGVGNSGNISILFDPSYQELQIHRVKVYRAEEEVDQLLKQENVQVIQRESAMERQIYDGRKTFVIILADLRINDVIEYSYTLKGSNPVFENKYYSSFNLQWASPVQKVFRRIIVPRKRKLNIRCHEVDIEHDVIEKRKTLEYIWDYGQVDAVISDPRLPFWYTPYPWCEISEYDSWEDVVDWAIELYKNRNVRSDTFNDLGNRIARLSASKARQVQEALKYVQKEIRYTGIEIGAQSYEPSLPEEIQERRFGDCKDKALLLVAILSHFGIESYPTLVNTSYDTALTKRLPSPQAFNHAIVQVVLDDKVYWLDATRLYQVGRLDALYQPYYGVALPIKKGVKDLVAMTLPGVDKSRRIVEERFDFTNHKEGAVLLAARTEITGYYAESIRFSIESKGRDRYEKECLSYYSGFYPGVEFFDKIQVQDDEENNTIIIRENYIIPEIWHHPKGKNYRELDFYPNEISDYFQMPASTERTMPLGLSFPVNLQYTRELLLPEKWDLTAEDVCVGHDAFDYRKISSYSNNIFSIKYHYVSKRSYIDADKVFGYVDKIRAVRDSLGCYITESLDSSEGGQAESNSVAKNAILINWPLICVLLVFGVIFVLLAVFTYRYRPLPVLDGDINKNLTGISGWLILPAMGLIIQPVSFFFGFVQTVKLYSNADWISVINPASECFDPIQASVAVYYSVASLFLLVFAVLLLIMFFRKMRFLPNLFIASRIIVICTYIIDKLICRFYFGISDADVQQGGLSLGGVVIASIIWGLYFAKSERVKSTFTCHVREGNVKPPPVPPPPPVNLYSAPSQNADWRYLPPDDPRRIDKEQSR